LNRTLINEAHVKAGLLITWISRSASQKKLMGICMHFQSRKTLTIACTIMSAECLCCWYIDLLQCAGEWAASKTFCQQDKGFPDSRVTLDMAFHNQHLSQFFQCMINAYPTFKMIYNAVLLLVSWVLCDRHESCVDFTTPLSSVTIVSSHSIRSSSHWHWSRTFGLLGEGWREASAFASLIPRPTYAEKDLSSKSMLSVTLPFRYHT